MGKNVLFSIIWLVILVFLAWPLAGFCAGIWIILLPFEAVFPFVKDITSFLEKLCTWPRGLGQAIMNCQESFPSPL